MSARAALNRQILYNITNMDDKQGEITTDKTLSGTDGGLRDVNGVKTLSPTFGATPNLSPSCGENANNSNKFESGSGSGEQEGGQPEDGIDIAAKKRKTRRGKPKHRKLKPYSKQISYRQTLKCRGVGRVTNTGGHPPAPYNTTQFLMEDRSDLPELEQKLAGVAAGEAVTIFQKPLPPRTRDSSFSIDSDEDYFYSSPEDEEEFLTKEFSSAYEDLHAERLGGLTKSELIQEYLQLETKLDLLTKRVRAKNFNQTDDSENKYTSGTESEIAKKLKICQQRIDDLIQQNEQLRRENDALKGQRRGSVASSVDSESDSDSSSDTSSCSRDSTSPIPCVTPSHTQYRREHASTKESKRNGSDCKTPSTRIDGRTTNEDSYCKLGGASPNSSIIALNIPSSNPTHEANGLPT